MFGGFGNRAAAYAKVGVETGVNTADPHKLILMLLGSMKVVNTRSSRRYKRKSKVSFNDCLLHLCIKVISGMQNV